LEDKRHHARVPINVSVNCEPAGGSAFQAIGRDVSVAGMFVESAVTPAFGTVIIIVGRIPGAKKDLRLPAIVRWTKADGFGVQFGLLGALETHVLTELMKSAQAS